VSKAFAPGVVLHVSSNHGAVHGAPALCVLMAPVTMHRALRGDAHHAAPVHLKLAPSFAEEQQKDNVFCRVKTACAVVSVAPGIRRCARCVAHGSRARSMHDSRDRTHVLGRELAVRTTVMAQTRALAHKSVLHANAQVAACLGARAALGTSEPAQLQYSTARCVASVIEWQQQPDLRLAPSPYELIKRFRRVHIMYTFYGSAVGVCIVSLLFLIRHERPASR